MQTFSEALDEKEKISKARNLFEVQEGSLYYYPEWGCDKDITSGRLEIQLSALTAYFRQTAFAHNINLTQLDAEMNEFTANLIFNVDEVRK